MDNNDKVFDIRQIIKIAGAAGAKAALDAIEKQKKKKDEKRRDRRLHNTKLLLQNYRMLKAHCNNAVYEASQLEDNIDIIGLMESVFPDDDLYVESVKRSAERTYIIISHIDEMLRLYEIYCSTSGKIEDRRRFNTHHALYIADKPMTVAEIADKESIDNRTVYKDIDNAVEKLTALIFGIDGLNVTK